MINPLTDPLARNSKFGWYSTFRKHLTMLTLSTNAMLMLIEDSIITNIDKGNTAQKMKFSIKDFFSKCDQTHCFLRIWSYLLQKSLMENFIFCARYF